MRATLRILLVLLGIGYPLLVYLGLRFFEPRLVALFLASTLLLRLAMGPRRHQVLSLGKTM
ncbi:MAG: hypothetical protein E2P04_06065, partial [Acidobacteria bacterium]